MVLRRSRVRFPPRDKCLYDLQNMASSKFWPPFNLHTGQSMPAVGFTTPDTNDREATMAVVEYALKSGYRSFETKAQSVSEAHIGEALRTYLPQHDLIRDDIFITTKLHNSHHCSKQRIIDNFTKSESSLQYTPDLFVIHFPPAEKTDKHKHVAWEAVTKLYDSGRVLSVGLTNFSVVNLKHLLKHFHSDIPVLNKVEWNPLNHDEGLLKYCHENSILLQGYHSLGGARKNEILKNSIIKDIADDNAASPAQVLLNWSLQRGVAVIPKATNSQHITENIDLNFNLNQQHINALDHFSIEPVKFTKDRCPVS